jgi:putative membrane protein
MRLLISLLINAAALWVAGRFVSGIRLPDTVTHLLLVALVFGLVNVTIKPVLKVLSFPGQILTLGLFTLVINAGMLLLTAALAKGWGFAVDGFGAAFWGALVISVVSALLGLLRSDDEATG